MASGQRLKKGQVAAPRHAAALPSLAKKDMLALGTRALSEAGVQVPLSVSGPFVRKAYQSKKQKKQNRKKEKQEAKRKEVRKEVKGEAKTGKTIQSPCPTDSSPPPSSSGLAASLASLVGMLNMQQLNQSPLMTTPSPPQMTATMFVAQATLPTASASSAKPQIWEESESEPETEIETETEPKEKVKSKSHRTENGTETETESGNKNAREDNGDKRDRAAKGEKEKKEKHENQEKQEDKEKKEEREEEQRKNTVNEIKQAERGQGVTLFKDAEIMEVVSQTLKGRPHVVSEESGKNLDLLDQAISEFRTDLLRAYSIDNLES